MSTSKLYIFSKDTDAPETQAGFEYQKLKTLETWLSNKIEGIDENIYCDFEDDIFQKKIEGNINRFRQIKLYSRNFSFASPEVHKALQHFFMLFVKSDYAGSDIEFVFEANSNIARTKGDNEAELKEWQSAQGKITGEPLAKCIAMAKTIINTYIDARAKELMEGAKDQGIKDDITSARQVYEALNDTEWTKFINAVRWQFDNQSPYEALESIRNNIKTLLERFPEPDKPGAYQHADAFLLSIVAERSIEKDPLNRVLNGALLDQSLLSMGDKNDVLYNAVYAKWNARKLTSFHIGEFFEIIDAAKYCRWSELVRHHNTFWESMLAKYWAMSDILANCKRKAVYELLMMNVQVLMPEVNWTTTPEPLIEFYFSNIHESETASDLEDALTLHQIISSLRFMGKVSCTEEMLNGWYTDINAMIDKKLAITQSPDTQCAYYELKGHACFLIRPGFEMSRVIADAMVFYNKIVDILPTAKMYNVNALSGKLDQKMNLIFATHIADKKQSINLLKQFIEKIEPIVQERKGKHYSAKKHVERGVNYLHQPGFENILEAINEFHKAKDLWNQERTLEGVILALMNLGQVYAAAEMHYASKFYALAALWDSIHMGTENFNRISGCYALITMADFENGAWASSLNDFQYFVMSHHNFDTNAWEEEASEMFLHAVSKEAMILAYAPLLCPAIQPMVDQKKVNLGWLMKHTFDPLLLEMQKTISVEKLFASGKLSQLPLNDIGQERTIKWSTGGHTWVVEFENEWETNAIAEELCCVLQIMQVEMTRRSIDMHLINTEIRIKLQKTAKGIYDNPVKKASHTENDFTLGLPPFEFADSKKMGEHYARIVTSIVYILKDLSVLKDEEIDTMLKGMYEEGFGSKTLIVNGYQVLLKEFFTAKEFEERKNIECKVDPTGFKASANKGILPSITGLSEKYTKQKAIQNISNRYRNFKKTLHLSLVEWKKDPQFIELIRQLRKDGWLDWQILIAINNMTASFKAQQNLQKVNFPSEQQYRQAAEAESNRILNIDESNTFLSVPVSTFQSDMFKFLLEQVPAQTLASYGLMVGSHHPHSVGVKELLTNRFSFSVDDVSELNPIADIV